MMRIGEKSESRDANSNRSGVRHCIQRDSEVVQAVFMPSANELAGDVQIFGLRPVNAGNGAEFRERGGDFLSRPVQGQYL